ncbi:hypothetical protein [Micromonospora sp. NBC_01412]
MATPVMFGRAATTGEALATGFLVSRSQRRGLRETLSHERES